MLLATHCCRHWIWRCGNHEWCRQKKDGYATITNLHRPDEDGSVAINNFAGGKRECGAVIKKLRCPKDRTRRQQPHNNQQRRRWPEETGLSIKGYGGQCSQQARLMAAIGLRPGKLPVRANDSNGLEAEEITGQGWWKQWTWGQGNCRSRPMIAMGLRQRKLPVKAEDSNGLEANKISSWSQWKQWAWGQGNRRSRPMTAIGLRSRKLSVEMTAMGLRQRESPIKADDSDEVEAKEIACRGRWQQWAWHQGNCPSRLMTAMGLRPRESPV